jgi:Lar family restriction alleviation protein
MSDELKPCPFCGGEGLLEQVEAASSRNKPNYYIVCRSCACEGGWHKTKSGAARHWNRRVGETTEAATLKHKAEQYDDVVKALQVADGGRYRNDTIEALLHRLSTLAALRSALAPFAQAAREKAELIKRGHLKRGVSIGVSLGDLRRAAEVVKLKEGELS